MWSVARSDGTVGQDSLARVLLRVPALQSDLLQAMLQKARTHAYCRIQMLLLLYRQYSMISSSGMEDTV
jgi:hypothetical protein